MTTVLADDEILTAVEVPVSAAGQGSAYEKFSHPASRYAVLGAAAHLTVQGGTCTAARVSIGGLLPSARRARAVETGLTGKPATDATFATAAAQVAADLGTDVTGDIYASAEYRRAMAPVYVKRALAVAATRAR
jgi:carbon-monoxide dehydrogenase medium subunit